MTTSGKIRDIYRDFFSGKWVVAIDLDETNMELFNDLFEKKLSLNIKPARNRRSIDANAYLWVLLSKLAEALHSTKDDVYEEQLRQHPIFYEDEQGYITMTLKADIPPCKIGGHWLPIKSDGKFTSYIMLKGSSEFDAKEMADFLDVIIEECETMGIETATPKEIERMNHLYEQSLKKRPRGNE